MHEVKKFWYINTRMIVFVICRQSPDMQGDASSIPGYQACQTRASGVNSESLQL